MGNLAVGKTEGFGFGEQFRIHAVTGAFSKIGQSKPQRAPGVQCRFARKNTTPVATTQKPPDPVAKPGSILPKFLADFWFPMLYSLGSTCSGGIFAGTRAASQADSSMKGFRPARRPGEHFFRR
jgi:hypothetical protein